MTADDPFLSEHAPPFKAGTLRGYRAGWRAWTRHHRVEPPSGRTVSDAMLHQFASSLQAGGLSVRTIETYLLGVAAAYATATPPVHLGPLGRYAWWQDFARMAREKRYDIRTHWSQTALERAARCVASHSPTGARDEALVALSQHGLSPKALSTLTWADMAEYMPSLSDTVRERLMAWRTTTTSGADHPVFLTASGRRWSARAIQRHLNALATI